MAHENPPTTTLRYPITPAELAPILGVKPRTIQRKANQRRIPHMRVGKLIKFTEQHVKLIQQMMERDVVEPRPEVDIPNPVYQPYAQVIPMRPDAA